MCHSLLHHCFRFAPATRFACSTTPSRRWLTALCLALSLLTNAAAVAEPGTKNQEPGTAAAAPFRPEAGKFPPLEKAHSYRGELVFVDHANRRGSLRVQGEGTYFRNAPHPFAMLPYGLVQYKGAPADLRDVPLGTVMHVRAFLPPDPTISSVPVLPIDNREKTAGYSGAGIAPAENHVLLLEDEPSHCLREGLVWKLKEVDLENNEGTIVASREPKAEGDEKATEETLTFDAATRIWRGREQLGIADFKKDSPVLMNGAENTLKHAGGNYGPAHMASKGPVVDLIKADGDAPLGSSGIQIRFETDLIIEGIRPGRVVRVRPNDWPRVDLPREEYLGDGNFSHEDRFPTPAIFPKY